MVRGRCAAIFFGFTFCLPAFFTWSRFAVSGVDGREDMCGGRRGRSTRMVFFFFGSSCIGTHGTKTWCMCAHSNIGSDSYTRDYDIAFLDISWSSTPPLTDPPFRKLGERNEIKNGKKKATSFFRFVSFFFFGPEVLVYTCALYTCVSADTTGSSYPLYVHHVYIISICIQIKYTRYIYIRTATTGLWVSAAAAVLTRRFLRRTLSRHKFETDIQLASSPPS